MLRQICGQLFRAQSPAPQLIRSYSEAAAAATTKLVNLEVNDKTGIATLTLNRPPVNSLNLELLTDIATALDEVELNRSKGLILTSVRTSSHTRTF